MSTPSATASRYAAPTARPAASPSRAATSRATADVVAVARKMVSQETIDSTLVAIASASSC